MCLRSVQSQFGLVIHSRKKLLSLNVTDVVFLINFDVNELTRSSISASRCTKVVLDFILSGFKPKVGNSLSFVNFRK